MITNFKIFENVNFQNYIDNFLIINNCIALCTEARFADKLSKKHIYVQFDCFDFNENNEIDNEAYGDHENFTKEDLNKLNFIAPTEFYNTYTDICINLYEKIKNDINEFGDFDGGDGGWYPKLAKNYKRVLETIPEFEHFAAAEKYNL